jgi:hypothetical protein
MYYDMLIYSDAHKLHTVVNLDRKIKKVARSQTPEAFSNPHVIHQQSDPENLTSNMKVP